MKNYCWLKENLRFWNWQIKSKMVDWEIGKDKDGDNMIITYNYNDSENRKQ